MVISREEAIQIAERHHGPEFKFSRILHGVPHNFGIYSSQEGDRWVGDDVWCVLCSLHQGNSGMLCSSRAIVISKDTGEILYDGSAGDEG